MSLEKMQLIEFQKKYKNDFGLKKFDANRSKQTEAMFIEDMASGDNTALYCKGSKAARRASLLLQRPSQVKSISRRSIVGKEPLSALSNADIESSSESSRERPKQIRSKIMDVHNQKTKELNSQQR